MMRYWLAAATILTSLTATVRADFTIRDVKAAGEVKSLADADALLSGVGVASETTATAAVINYSDEGPVGHFLGDAEFPGSVAAGSSRDDFAIHATAGIVIATAGTYTFGVNSDDGVRLRIDSGSGFADVIVDDRLHAYEDHFGVATFAAAGVYALDLVFFEHTGQASVELFAARGSFQSFGDTNAWRLVGDSATGGIATAGPNAVPEPASLAMLALGAAAVGLAARRSRRGA